MKVKICIYCFLCFYFFANGQVKIEFHSQEVGYGTVEQNSNPFREIEFTNIGSDTLFIYRIRSSGTLLAMPITKATPAGRSGK